jgi:hypothetical protein
VSLDGQRFEIPSRYRGLEHIHLRYARWDFSRVDLIDARTGQILCPIAPSAKRPMPMRCVGVWIRRGHRT